VCAQTISFSLDNGILHDVKFYGGCPGNTVAISKLIEGKNAMEIAQILKGNDCGARGTSCADQLSIAIQQALVKENSLSNN
ncbi:TIGR03905 family TSCPD domain-containing protein, partial [bacterium]|nr:TIGR03905 family TSCPD domain-containing protein [bacterium]